MGHIIQNVSGPANMVVAFYMVYNATAKIYLSVLKHRKSI